MTSHFSPIDWVDFVRGVPSAHQRALIERHLEDDCEACRKDSRMWRIVFECLSREPDYQVPETVLRVVKAEFPSERPLSLLGQIAEMARLVFDSWEHPSAVALRASMMQSARQLIHEAEPFVIDLRIENDPGKGVLLTGQIVNSLHPDRDIESADVMLLRGDRLVATTSANPLGEFHLDFKAEEELRLFISIHGHRAIGMPLPTIERGNGE